MADVRIVGRPRDKRVYPMAHTLKPLGDLPLGCVVPHSLTISVNDLNRSSDFSERALVVREEVAWRDPKRVHETPVPEQYGEHRDALLLAHRRHVRDHGVQAP